jgi:DNA polymerase III delta prime subunit
MSEHMLWVEKYRPHKVEDCILPDTMKATFQQYVNKKEIPNLLLSGTAGVGKTTVAMAMCDEIGCDYLVINGSDDRGIATIQNQVKNYATSMSLSGGRKVVIIDEADNLTPDAQKALRGIIENVSSNCSFIFTCNYKNRILDALHSRCAVIDFKTTGNKAALATQFMKRVEFILEKEGIPYKKDVIASVIMKYFPDNRRTLNELQRYSMTGSIDAGILSSVSEVQLSELVSSLKGKDFREVRRWVTNNLDQEPVRIFRSLYDNLSEKISPQSIPPLVLILAKYQYQAAFVADHEINLMACMTEIMVECEFK